MRRRNYEMAGRLIAYLMVLMSLAGCGGSGSLDESASIVLSADTTSTYADGVSSVAITATVTDSSGIAIPAYSDVSFYTSNGSFRNGSRSYGVTTKDASGVVVASLIAPDAPGFAEVTCESSGVTQSIRIDFIHYDNSGEVTPEGFGLSIEYHNLSGLWLAGLENTVWAHLGDAKGNAVQDGTPVYFSTYNTGGFFDPDMAVTGGVTEDETIHGPGTASSTLYTTPNPSPAQGMVSVTAETDGGPTTHITSIAVTPAPDDHILYAGTNGGGVYKSTDSGRSWENVSKSTVNARAGQNWIDPYIKGNSAIAVDPDHHNTIYVGTGYLGEGNLFRSLDGGLNWNSNDVEEWNGIYNTNTAVLSVLCDDGGSDYVWMGTEGQGVLYSEDGTTFQPSGGTVDVTSSLGDGVIEAPKVGYSAQSEVWTLTCFVPDATVNSPSIFTDIDPVELEENPYAPPAVLTASDPATNGRIENISTSPSTLTETWTVTYTMLDTDVQIIDSPENKGTVIDVEPKQHDEQEMWTLTCVKYEAIDTVLENVETGVGKGTVINVDTNQSVTREHWILTCVYVDISGNQLLGDQSAIFTVESSEDGRLSQDAILNVDYVSDRINFRIIPGSSPFIVGDVIEFDTYYTSVDSPFPGAEDLKIFTVYSSLEGRQQDAVFDPSSLTGSAYSTDRIDFTIVRGQEPFMEGDVIQFITRPQNFWRVNGSISGQQAGTATTGSNYTSDNSEVSFKITAGKVPFTHLDTFTFQTYEARPAYWTVEGSKSGMQAGIAQTGQVYTSDNGEITFTIAERGSGYSDGNTIKLRVEANKLSHGWTVWDFVKVPGTHGDTAVLYAATNTGVYKSLNGGRTWDANLVGSFTGDAVSALALYPADNGEDILYAGTQNAGVWGSVDSGETWTQYAANLGQGTTIKDVVLDSYNHRLYALSWTGQSDAAAGQVFAMDLTGDNQVASGTSWQESTDGLSGAALYAMALDNPDLAGEVYVGGEGIRFHHATSGLMSGLLPQWIESSQGLSNRIMARIPVLFSGEAVLSYDLVQYDNLVFLTVYIQDYNGNPPIAGSTYSATFHSEADGSDYTWDDFTYPDTYSYRGTFRDPGNGLTNIPYQYVTMVGSGDEITLTYNPLCNEGDDRAAGCSGGSEQTYTISF